eukprot:tig00020965_g16869.t1
MYGRRASLPGALSVQGASAGRPVSFTGGAAGPPGHALPHVHSGAQPAQRSTGQNPSHAVPVASAAHGPAIGAGVPQAAPRALPAAIARLQPGPAPPGPSPVGGVARRRSVEGPLPPLGSVGGGSGPVPSPAPPLAAPAPAPRAPAPTPAYVKTEPGPPAPPGTSLRPNQPGIRQPVPQPQQQSSQAPHPLSQQSSSAAAPARPHPPAKLSPPPAASSPGPVPPPKPASPGPGDLEHADGGVESFDAGYADSRTVRAFLSSTFRDMAPERDAIFKSAVPRIRRALADRGLFFVAVDLRWGITEEAAKGGEVVRLCLREVLRSRYFIGFLKKRYGWHQDPSAPRDALLASSVERATGEFPFLRRFADRSVTEWEVRLGAFLDASGAPAVRKDTSRFYFASASLMEASAREPGDAEVPAAAAKLAALKEEIRATEGLRVADYGGASELAAAVYADLMEMVERDFPRGRERSWLQEERAAHEAFGQARRRLYFADRGDYERIDAYAGGSGPELLLLRGESGSGKSALLANWSASWRRRYPDDLLIVHFVGGSQQSARVTTLIQRVAEEAREAFPNLPALEMGGPESELMGRFGAWLSEAALLLPRRLLLVADALDQLADEADAQLLAWLPPAAAPRLRVIVSTVAAGRAAEAAAARAHAAHAAAPLDPTRRRGVIEACLRQARPPALYSFPLLFTRPPAHLQAGKSLSEGQLGRLLHAAPCANPLFLTKAFALSPALGYARPELYAQVLLEELEAGAVHETLEARMGALLACSEPRDLYAKVPPPRPAPPEPKWREAHLSHLRLSLHPPTVRPPRQVIERWSGLYGAALVEGSLCAIVCSRHGLADAELQASKRAPLAILLLGVGDSAGAGGAGGGGGGGGGADGKAVVSPLAWSEFLAVAGSVLINRDGLFGFFHRAASEAVEELYGIEGRAGAPPAAAAARRAWHARLGDFFARQARPAPPRPAPPRPIDRSPPLLRPGVRLALLVLSDRHSRRPRPSDAQPAGRRRAEEGPWQLARAGEAARLADLLADLDTLRRLTEARPARPAPPLPAPRRTFQQTNRPARPAPPRPPHTFQQTNRPAPPRPAHTALHVPANEPPRRPAPPHMYRLQRTNRPAPPADAASTGRHELVALWEAPARYERAIGRAEAAGAPPAELALHWQRAGALLRLLGLLSDATPFLERAVRPFEF